MYKKISFDINKNIIIIINKDINYFDFAKINNN